MSSTLDLVNDYFRFVTRFIEVISVSAPHIYHSALPLAPRTSIVRKLYESYAYPLARIVRGLPDSWEPITAATGVWEPVWSPCGRFIAILRPSDGTVDVVDGTTLAKLNTLSLGEAPRNRIHMIRFSPDSRLLTVFHDMNLTSWDLQTGGCIGTSTLSASRDPSLGLDNVLSCTHSVDGKTIAVAHRNLPSWIISIFDLPSGTQACPHRSPEGHIVGQIWTHGERLRFAVVRESSIVIQETGFTSSAVLDEVESFPAPPESMEHGHRSIFLPSLSRMAFSSSQKIWVWDARRSKFLLKYRHYNVNGTPRTTFSVPPRYEFLLKHSPHNAGLKMTFSSDGEFFAATTSPDRDIYLWKNSSAGYVLHRKFPHTALRLSPILSPDGESIIIQDINSVRLWPTRGQLVPPSASITTLSAGKFILEFSPDGTLAAAARPRLESKVIVIDLKSGNLRLVLDINDGVTGLGLTGNSVVVVSDEKATTWNIPLGGRSLSEKWKFLRSPQTKVPLSVPGHPIRASVSPSLDRIALCGVSPSPSLWVLNGFTGRLACSTTLRSSLGIPFPWFTQDGCEIWTTEGQNPLRGWKIIEGSEPGSTELKPLGPTVHPSGGFPWESRLGYEVTPEGWVRSSSGKLLVWLPGQWRSGDRRAIIWHGQFVGLLRGELSEPVILELSE